MKYSVNITKNNTQRKTQTRETNKPQTRETNKPQTRKIPKIPKIQSTTKTDVTKNETYRQSKASRESRVTSQKNKNTSKDASSSKNIRDKSNIEVLKSLLQCKTYLEVKDKLMEFYNNSKINDTQIQIMSKTIIPLNKGGKSGSVVGYFKPNEITKLFIRALNQYEIVTIHDCLKLSNIFNEMLINFLVSNLPKIIPSITRDEKQLLDEHSLKLLNYGISSGGSFITIPLVGINGITNLRELLEQNHSKLFKINTLSVPEGILELYDQLMASKITDYCKTLHILQKYLKYVNSDVKMTNIFIRSKSGQGLKKFKTSKIPTSLEEFGIITDFDLIISDLEKSVIEINDLKITTAVRSPMKIKLAGLIGQKLIYDIRYGCSEIVPACENISILDIDIIMLVIDYYAFMLQMDKDFINKMTAIYNTFKELLGVELLGIITYILEKGKYKIDDNFSFEIGKVLKKICKKM
jgi:hypothetical protein